jgi:hypothetical protein
MTHATNAPRREIPVRRFRNRLPAAAAGVLLLAALKAAAAPSPDPIEGKWLGEAGFPQDRIEVGLEFKRNSSGELKAYLYEPVGNFYGLELPGTVER